ncbi:MAG TPA: hypothetical protein VM408_05325 [Methylomirabilota bacterium]|nr:hypothetical protein [Methylomirabilota bacterium]
MRARRFELRLLGGALVGAWGIAAILVLLAYRPGGPLDVVVGITMLVPLGIAFSGLVWPPVARGRDTYPMVVALGVGSLLLLLPSIGGVLNQLQALGSQTLMPSLEAAYPWLLALAGTSLFAGFGLARRLDAGTALRPRRLRVGTAVAFVFTLVAGTTFAGAAIANELALRDRTTPPASSRFGPTDPEAELPACDALLSAGTTSRLITHLRGDIDGHTIGSVDLSGVRVGTDFRWLAYVATARELGQYGAASFGGRAWTRTPVGDWATADAQAVREQTLDLQAVRTALARRSRSTAEDRGIEVIEGARARRCRVAVEGATFRSAFPQVEWLVGDADLTHWRGQLDYWVFVDGGLGQVAGSINGEAGGIQPEAIQGTIEVFLTATERGREQLIYPPSP